MSLTPQQKARPWLHRPDNGRARLFDAERLSQAVPTHDTLFDDGWSSCATTRHCRKKSFSCDGTVMPVSEHTQRTRWCWSRRWR